MRFPEDRREILRSSSDGGHSEGLSLIIIGVIEIIFALSKINYFHFFVGHEEEVGRFHISVADSFALQERTSGD